jgi:hypothetical protein
MSLNSIRVVCVTPTPMNGHPMITHEQKSTTWTRYKAIPITGIWVVDVFGSCFWMREANVLPKAGIARAIHVADSALEWVSSSSPLLHIQ